MTRNERLCEGKLPMSLLEESNRSDAARSSSIGIGNSDCENRTGGEHQKGPQVEVWFEIVVKRHAGSWLSRLPFR